MGLRSYERCLAISFYSFEKCLKIHSDLGAEAIDRGIWAAPSSLGVFFSVKTTHYLQKELVQRNAQQESRKRCVYSSWRGALQARQGLITYIFPSE